MTGCVSDGPEGAILNVRVIPRARRSAVDGTRAGAVLIRLVTAPVDGAANEALIDLLARTLGVPRRSIRFLAGVTNRDKRIQIVGVSAAVVSARLAVAADL